MGVVVGAGTVGVEDDVGTIAGALTGVVIVVEVPAVLVV